MLAAGGDAQQIRLAARPGAADQRLMEVHHVRLGKSAGLGALSPGFLMEHDHVSEEALGLLQRGGAVQREVRAVEAERAPDLGAGVGAEGFEIGSVQRIQPDGGRPAALLHMELAGLSGGGQSRVVDTGEHQPAPAAGGAKGGAQIRRCTLRHEQAVMLDEHGILAGVARLVQPGPVAAGAEQGEGDVCAVLRDGEQMRSGEALLGEAAEMGPAQEEAAARAGLQGLPACGKGAQAGDRFEGDTLQGWGFLCGVCVRQGRAFFFAKKKQKTLTPLSRPSPIGHSLAMSLADLPSLLLIPPLNCLVAACAGAVLHRRRAGRVLLGVGLAGLAILSLPLVSGLLIVSLEGGLPQDGDDTDPPQAIVILSADMVPVSVHGGVAFTVGGLTLERERAGAALARRVGLPVLVSGGRIRPGAPSLAALMALSLRADFGIAPQWLEERSTDTWENAARSAEILRDAGIGRVYLVTHAWHMRRALIAFRAAGLNAVPAPALPDIAPRLVFSEFVPHVSSWQVSYWALHEWIGCAWYALRG